VNKDIFEKLFVYTNKIPLSLFYHLKNEVQD
jgi:hypothetical protein